MRVLVCGGRDYLDYQNEGKPDLVVAFPGGVGTADMISRAMKAGIKVEVINS